MQHFVFYQRAGVEVVVASVMTGKQVKLARGLNLVADCMIDEVSAADFDLVWSDAASHVYSPWKHALPLGETLAQRFILD